MKKIDSEWKLIEQIRKRIDREGALPENLEISIGDDCAVFSTGIDTFGLLTTDVSVDSVHFKMDMLTPEDIGFKAMMANISDITAMGGKPDYALVTLGLPPEISAKYVARLYEGMLEAAQMANVHITGGDTSRAGQFFISIALYGNVLRQNLLTRSGASAGDIIYLTGTIGNSRAGLDILLSGEKNTRKNFPTLTGKHIRPEARHKIIGHIIEQYTPCAMIDLSDGLLSDLRHICTGSKTGFKIETQKLPLSDEFINYCRQVEKNPYHYALASGEEYELIYTSRNKKDKSISTYIDNVQITPIGEIIEKGFYLGDKKLSEQEVTGYEHFK